MVITFKLKYENEGGREKKNKSTQISVIKYK